MSEAPPPPVEIPVDSLSPELLNEIILSFIEREGTDYGAVEATVERKIADVRRQLDRGEIKLMFEPETESVTFIVKGP
jgi:uncharacterized protein YheU (UPF0270 family)